MKHAVSLGFALAAFFAAPIAAEATLITQSRDFRAISFTSRTGPADRSVSADVSFAAFDPALGRLERVELQLDGFVNFSGSFTCLNSFGDSCLSLDAVSSVLILRDSNEGQLDRLSVPLINELPIGSAGFGVLAGGNSFISIAVHEDNDFEVIFGDLTEFLGNPVTFDVRSNAFFVAGTGVTRLDRLDRHEIAGTATLSYFFEEAPDVVAIPAPASLPLFAAGLAALGFAGSFRRGR